MIKTFKREKIRDQLPKIGMEDLFLGQFWRVCVQLLFVEKIKKPIFRARFSKKSHLRRFLFVLLGFVEPFYRAAKWTDSKYMGFYNVRSSSETNFKATFLI